MLRPAALTAAAFAPFGDVIELPAAAGLGGASLINDGSTRRHEAIASLDLVSDGGRAVLALYDAAARTFPFTALEMERHRLSDQVFLPLGAARRCVLLVAPAGPPPESAALAAFVADGRQGVRLRAGTWHHGLLALDDGLWAVLERRAVDGAVDCDVHVLTPPVRLDLTP